MKRHALLSMSIALIAAVGYSAPAAGASGPYRVKDINTSGDSRPGWLTPMGNTLFFVAKGGNTGRELWKSDGTAVGTARVKDIRPGSAASNPNYLAVANGLLWFNADDGVHGRELWVSDGTTAGTRLVKDIWPGANSSEASMFFEHNGTVYFRANTGATGQDLWRTNGTAAGTKLVKDVAWGAPASHLFCCSSIGGRLFFIYYNPYTGTDRLYVTNGTAKGTKPFRDRNGDLVQGSIGGLTVVGSLLYFGYDAALWRTDGTSAETRKLADIATSSIVGRGSTAFIDDYYGLWASDGTAATTRLVLDQPVHDDGLFNLDDELLFFTDADEGPTEAWTTDGTEVGTQPIGEQVSINTLGMVLNGVAYFGGYSDAEAETYTGPSTCFFEPSFLWRSDGTAAGTYNVNPELDYCLGNLTVVGNSVFFTADVGSAGNELWRYVP